MREVRLIAISDDGTHLILSGDDDERLALQIDETLHAAIRGDRARLGQLEIQLENQLRPKDIQARIRAGESVEAVAAVAGMPLEKVRRFAGPVLAEREHIAGRARQATIRRIHADGPPRVLDDAAASAAAAAGADPENTGWDAWRRDDGRWQVRCSWRSPSSETDTTALFSFDPSGRSVLADDDIARAVAGDVVAEPEPNPADAVDALVAPSPEPDAHDSARDDSPGAEVTAPVRLSVVPPAPEPDEDELQATMPQGVVGADAATSDGDSDHDSDGGSDRDSERAAGTVADRRARRSGRGRADRRRREPALWAPEQPAEPVESAEPAEPVEPAAASAADEEPTSERLHLSDIASRVEVDDTPEPAPKPARQAKSGSRSRRPSVPTWDEIMFGRRKTD